MKKYSDDENTEDDVLSFHTANSHTSVETLPDKTRALQDSCSCKDEEDDYKQNEKCFVKMCLSEFKDTAAVSNWLKTFPINEDCSAMLITGKYMQAEMNHYRDMTLRQDTGDMEKQDFYYENERVCKECFCFVNSFSERHLQNLKKHPLDIKECFGRHKICGIEHNGRCRGQQSDVLKFLYFVTSMKDWILDSETTKLLQDDDLKTSKEHLNKTQETRYWEGPKKGRIWRIQHDKDYRYKFIKTVCFWWAFLMLGWSAAQFGPAFPDLRLITDTELETASYLFTSGSFGYLFGSVVSGVLYDRFSGSGNWLIFGSVFGNAVTTALLPWFPSFPVMMFLRFAMMSFGGGLDTVGHAEMMVMWKAKEKAHLLTMHFMYGVGGVVSPMVTELFLLPTDVANDVTNIGVSLSSANNSYSADCQRQTKENVNTTDVMDHTTNLTDIKCPLNWTSQEYYAVQETRVQYAFLITAVITFIISIPFLFLQCEERRRTQLNEHEMTDTADITHVYKLTAKKQAIIMTVLTITFFTYNSVEDTFFGYLMTYCLTQLQWSKYLGSLATSIYWAGFGTGRLIGIFVMDRINSSRPILLSLSSLVIFFILFLIGSTFYTTPLLWVSFGGLGLSISITFPTLMMWVEENVVHLSGKLASLVMISCSVGQMTNPLYLGFLMEDVSPQWFVYICLGQSVIELISFAIAYKLSGIGKHGEYNIGFVRRQQSEEQTSAFCEADKVVSRKGAGP